MRSINIELTQAELTWLQDGLSKIISNEIKRVRKYVCGDEDDQQVLMQCQYISRMNALRDRLQEHLNILETNQEDI